MFNKDKIVSESSKKTGFDKEYSPVENALSARGQLQSSNRFRGWIIFFLLIISASTAMVNVYYVTHPRIVVGITEKGRPELLNASERTLALDLFGRDFIGKFLCYDPSTIDRNMRETKNITTDGFQTAFNSTLGSEFIGSVKEYGVMQITSVSDIKIEELKEDGFFIIANVSRIKSDNLIKQTVANKLRLKVSVVRGPVITSNPWGWYVDSIVEEIIN